MRKLVQGEGDCYLPDQQPHHDPAAESFRLARGHMPAGQSSVCISFAVVHGVCCFLVSSVSCSPAAQSGPSIGFTFTPSIPLIEEGAGEAASLTLPHVQNFMKVFVHHHGSCLEGPQNPHYKGQKQAQHRLRCARAAFRYPDQGLLTSLRYRVCVS